MARPLELSVRDLRALVDYNRAVFDRFARRVRRLPLDAAMKRRGTGHESLFQTLVHILNVQEVWWVYILRGRTSDAELEALFQEAARKPTDWKGFDRYRRRVWAGVDETLSALTPARLGARVSVFWMPGRYTVRDGALQTTFEEAHHLGEIIGALWQDDIEPPAMTWIDVRRAAERSARRRPR
ncbi:MAG TPA: DinB family protein [Thermoplasmata archaeon]|nr:DinB family protein [Thermoplasmata archaeon]